MLVSMLSCYRSSIKKIILKNNIRLISNVPFNDNNFTLYKFKESFLVRKFYDINDWYIKFTGLDEIKRLQDKVIITQERLEKVQEERREIGKVIVNVRKDVTVVQEQLHQVKKWEDVQKFVNLTQKEAELIKNERELSAQFEGLDKNERELFSVLCNTIRDSHEKEKAQSEYTKYWGIILSIIGTIVGAVISTIISTIRNRQIIFGINKNVEDKFNEITNMYKNDSLNNNNDKNVLFLRNENRDFSKLILENLSENVKEIKLLRNESINFSKLMLDQLNKHMNDTTNMVIANRSRYLLSINDIKKDDKFIDLSYFMKVNQMQHEQMIATIFLGCVGVGVISFICGCICR